jgi:uncharacterized protein YhbP (UPF0306 family)
MIGSSHAFADLQYSIMKMSDNKELMSFIVTQRACVLSVLLDTTQVHSAAILYATDELNNRFYFTTDKSTEKCQPFYAGKKTVPASLVVGTAVGTPYTMQLRGILRTIASGEKDHNTKLAYLIAKHGNNRNKHWNDLMVLLEFEPIQGKFTDYSVGWTTTELDFS